MHLISRRTTCSSAPTRVVSGAKTSELPVPALPSLPALRLVTAAVATTCLGVGCAPCDLQSTVQGFSPVCDEAVLARYPDETRLVVLSAEGGALVAYLPAPIEELPYGGTTGRAITVMVETDKGELWAGVPEAEVTIQSLGPDDATVGLSIELDEGWIYGQVDTAVEFRD